MADNPQPIQVTITAQIKGLMDGLTAATAGVKASTAEMTGSFSKLTSVVNGLKAPFLAITAILGGGALFKSAITDTINWTMEVNKLSKSMAINMNSASAWAVMLHTLGISSDTMTGIMQKLQVRMGTSAKAFVEHGIATRDANGALKPTAAVLTEITDKYNSLGTQQEKNALLASLFGRAWLSVLPLMRATSERLAEATLEAHNLGLEVGPDGVAKARAYTESMNHLHLVVLALGNSVGKSLLPILTSLSTWVGGAGKTSTEGLSTSLKYLASAFYTVDAAIRVVIINIEGDLMRAMDHVAAIFAATKQAMTGNFSEAWATIKSGMERTVIDAQAQSQLVAEAWGNRRKEIDALWAKPIGSNEPEGGAGAGGGLGGDKGGGAEAEAWEIVPLAATQTKMHWDFDQIRAGIREQLAETADLTKQEGQKAWDALATPNLSAFHKNSSLMVGQMSALTRSMASLTTAAFSSVSNGFTQTIRGMLLGTQSFNQGLANMFRNIALSFASSLGSMLTRWIEHLILKSILKNTYEESDAKKGAFRDAKDAARGGFKAGMHLPFPLNVVMAPALAAIGFAGVMASASGGWERVPATTLAMLHTDEQVLPARYAEGLRNLVEGDGNPGSGGNVQVHFNGVVDAKSFFQQHQGAIVSTIQGAVKNRRMRTA